MSQNLEYSFFYECLLLLIHTFFSNGQWDFISILFYMSLKLYIALNILYFYYRLHVLEY